MSRDNKNSTRKIMEKDQYTNLYKDYLNDVFRYSMFKLRNKENAEDVTSEAFLRAMGKNLKEIGNKKLWMIQIARNVIYERYRKETPRKEDKDLTEGNMEIIDTTTNIEEKILTEEMLEIIKRNLDKLDDETREVLILRIWEELQFNEIAELLKEKESTIKLRFYRGMEKLKLSVEEEQGKKMRAITFPFIIFGITRLSRDVIFKVSEAFKLGLASKLNLNNNLLISNSNMAVINKLSSLLSTTTAKVVIITVGSLVIVGAGAIILNNNAPVKNTVNPPKVTAVQQVTKAVSQPAGKPNTQAVQEVMVSYTIKNSDGSSVVLDYPQNWEVRTFNGGQTYAFVSPDGSAFGYDFHVYDGIDNCGSTSEVIINGTYGIFKRYYDVSNAGVNWYVCQFNAETASFFLDNSNLLSVYAANTQDLATIDNIVASIKFVNSYQEIATAVAKGLFSVNYSPRNIYMVNNVTNKYGCMIATYMGDNTSKMDFGPGLGSIDTTCGPSGVGPMTDLGTVQFDILGGKITTHAYGYTDGQGRSRVTYNFNVDSPVQLGSKFNPNGQTDPSLNKIRFYIDGLASSKDDFLPVFQRIMKSFKWIY